MEKTPDSLQTIVFDFDGTLADSAQCGVIATTEAFKSHGLPVPKDKDITDLMGIPIETSFKTLGADILNEQQFNELLSSFREIYKSNSESSIVLFPGIYEMLDTIKKDKKNVAIVSSKKTEVLKKNCKQLKIDHFIDVFIGSDLVQLHKPAPEGLHLALKLINNSDLAKAIYIGDATVDIMMGTSAGVKTCAVLWGAHSEEELLNSNPTYIAPDVFTLENILKLTN
ncbi:HAD family hydrolase [Chryseobacterium indologenes]|uniref:HAD family hydrolase n=1 Tax=Chryseobacterium indologenes TaxID=253 RepID=UPI000764B37D|nr:HAD-IA family hydrolase [Chryseobacterium indologenes]